MGVVPRAIGQVDRWAGQALERAVRDHHRRRLERTGRGAQLEPPEDGALWCAGEPPPRPGCQLEVLVDGANALPQIAAAIASARSHVHIAGWHLEPGFGLTRDTQALALRNLLAEVAGRVDVRVLLWAGSPAPVFTPSRSEVREAREHLVSGTRVRCALDSNERPMHCHHEKLVIVDDEVAFVGGIDLTGLGGDRFDGSEHPVRAGRGWHDASSRIRGGAVADVAEHFACRWQEAAGERLAPPAAPATPSAPSAGPGGGPHTVQVVRTVPEKIYDFAPHGDFRILEAYKRALRSAQQLVYLESQFLWSPELVAILADKLRRPPREDFRLLVVLPAKPNNGEDMTRGQLSVLVDADDGNDRFLAATLSSRTAALAGPLYVHAKIGIVDDRWLTLGSANLNDHSLFNDTEMNVVCCEPELARETRLSLWAEHLERPVAEIDGEPARVIDELWRPIAREQLERRRRGERATHHLLELPGVSRRSRALLGPLDGLFVDG